MTVHSGHFQDPDARPGLAHFHEHMLFLGNAKYPREDEYNRFLSEHGGASNAFTMAEYTTYHLKVAEPHLHGALDRFAQFFISPSFDLNLVEREMRAIDSESTNYSTEDGWRTLQVLKTTVAEGHPFRRFDVGNLRTLSNGGGVKVARDELISWNHKHYRAGSMKLAVVGRDCLDDLEEVVSDLFGDVPSSPVNTAAPGSCTLDQPEAWPQTRLGRRVSLVPFREQRSLSVSWPLPPQSDHLFAKPELYIAHVLGHEGPGSLHDVLNRRGWVEELWAGPVHSFSDVQLCSVNVKLTPEGDANRDAVVALLFEYVELVRKEGPQESMFREIQALQEIAFAHKEDDIAPDDLAVAAATALHHYPPEEVLRGPMAVDHWMPDVVSQYLDLLRPERCLLLMASPTFSQEACEQDGSKASAATASGWQREHWYGALFQEQQIERDELTQWNKLAAEEADGSELALPELNRFIPHDFTLRGQGTNVSSSRLPMEVSPPSLLINSPLMRVWHKTDCAFLTPREYVLAFVHMPVYETGPTDVALMRLFCGVVKDDLNTFAYDASIAGLTYSFEFAEHLSLSAGGFSDKLSELLNVVVGRVGDLLVEAEHVVDGESDNDGEFGRRGQELADKLETHRQVLLEDYGNLYNEEPWSAASYYSSQLMVHGSWHLSDYIAALSGPIPLETLAAAVRRAFAAVRVEVLVHGNVNTEEAEQRAKLLESAFCSLGAAPAPAGVVHSREVTQLPAGRPVVFELDLAAKNPAQENSCTQNIYQVGSLHEDWCRDACTLLLGHMAGTSAYQKLRTDEQLGYIVQAGAWIEHHVCGLAVLVQGNRLPPKEVDTRIESWLSCLVSEIEVMSEDDFSNNITSVVGELSQRHSRMAQETLQHWAEIQPRRYRFDRLPMTVEALKALRKEQLLHFFREYLAVEAPQRRKLSMQVLGASATRDSSTVDGPHSPAETVVHLSTLEELRHFRATCSAFPAPVARHV